MPDLQFDWDDLDAAFDGLDVELSAVARGLTVEIFDRILDQTPQSIGRAVASWTYSLNGPQFIDRSDEFAIEEGGPDDIFTGGRNRTFSRGSPTAINLAKRFNLGNDTSFRLGAEVWIANGVDHGEGGYADKLEDGVGLRPDNQPGRMVARALDYASAKYGEGVSAAAVTNLKNKRIGI